MTNLAQMPLILASASPRRAEILRAVDWPFTVQPADVDETPYPSEVPRAYVMRLAQSKALAIAANLREGLVLGADTVVVAANQICGKPRDEADARQMLRGLSGDWHKVLTGVALAEAGGTIRTVFCETTLVKFARLTDAEIAAYIATGEPMDKAGGYAIQGRAALFIEEIAGDYWNVVGLPVRKLYEVLSAKD